MAGLVIHQKILLYGDLKRIIIIIIIYLLPNNNYAFMHNIKQFDIQSDVSLEFLLLLR